MRLGAGTLLGLSIIGLITIIVSVILEGPSTALIFSGLAFLINAVLMGFRLRAEAREAKYWRNFKGPGEF